MTWSGVVIPFRYRGGDELRIANFYTVRQHWLRAHGIDPMCTSDGREGDAQFNRSAAYNQGIREHWGPEVFIFAESDMLISGQQIRDAVRLAMSAPGLVVPFTNYHYLSATHSELVRSGFASPLDRVAERVFPDRKAVGAINVVSRHTMNLIGQWDEGFEGNWYDDDAMKIAFEVCAGPTRFIEGPAYHLHHLPGWKGSHRTAEDKAATARNKARLGLYRAAKTPERIRELTAGGQ